MALSLFHVGLSAFPEQEATPKSSPESIDKIRDTEVFDSPSFIPPRCEPPLQGKPQYPYVFRRIYECQHPDEFIKVILPPKHNIPIHMTISQSDFEQEVSKQTYSMERCQQCRIRSSTYSGLRLGYGLSSCEWGKSSQGGQNADPYQTRESGLDHMFSHVHEAYVEDNQFSDKSDSEANPEGRIGCEIGSSAWSQSVNNGELNTSQFYPDEHGFTQRLRSGGSLPSKTDPSNTIWGLGTLKEEEEEPVTCQHKPISKQERNELGVKPIKRHITLSQIIRDIDNLQEDFTNLHIPHPASLNENYSSRFSSSSSISTFPSVSFIPAQHQYEEEQSQKQRRRLSVLHILKQHYLATQSTLKQRLSCHWHKPVLPASKSLARLVPVWTVRRGGNRTSTPTSITAAATTTTRLGRKHHSKTASDRQNTKPPKAFEGSTSSPASRSTQPPTRHILTAMRSGSAPQWHKGTNPLPNAKDNKEREEMNPVTAVNIRSRFTLTPNSLLLPPTFPMHRSPSASIHPHHI